MVKYPGGIGNVLAGRSGRVLAQSLSLLRAVSRVHRSPLASNGSPGVYASAAPLAAFGDLVKASSPTENVNDAAMRRQVDRQARAGTGVFCAGANGEFYALSFEEKIRVAELCVEAAAGRVPVLAHIGETSTHQTIALGKKIENLDVQAVSVITPSFLPCSQAELIAH
jgi:dihydrodipicolinate synthase/N-acetylneuraminate lyase